jgi:hypothetical protein
MERLLARLDRKLGRYAPENITIWLVGLSAVCTAIAFARPDLLPYLWFDAPAISSGEVWRLATCLFAPLAPVGTMGILLYVFALMFLYTLGTSLTAQWGALRFDLFVFCGGLATLATGFLFGPVTGDWMAAAIFLAFAAEFPDYEIMPFILVPITVKVKWLGLITAAFMIWGLISGGVTGRVEIAVAVLDLLLFCGGTLLDRARGVSRSVAGGRASRSSDRGRARPASAPGAGAAARTTPRSSSASATARKSAAASSPSTASTTRGTTSLSRTASAAASPAR